MEIQDPNLKENGENQNLQRTAGGDQGTQKTPEEIIAEKDRQLKASQAESIRLAKENEEFRKSKETAVIPEDEKRIREIVSKLKLEELQEKKLEDEKLEKELIDLEGIYGTFDRKKLLNIVDRYGVYNEEGNTNWDKAMELYRSLDNVPTEPIKKIPNPGRENPQAQEVEIKPEVSKKSLSELAEEGLKRFGIK